MKASLAKLDLGDSLAGLFAYAVTATVLAAIVFVLLGKLPARVGEEAAITR